jgi:hypothetical protein
MKGLTAELLEAVEVEAVFAIEVNVFARKIIAHRADEMGRGEKARSDCGVTGGSAKESRVFRVRGFDGIEGGGADY